MLLLLLLIGRLCRGLGQTWTCCKGFQGRDSESREQRTRIWKISHAKPGACTCEGCVPNAAGGAGRGELGQTWASCCEKAWLLFLLEIWLSFKNEMKHKCTWERGSRSNSTKREVLQWESSVAFQQCPSQELVVICTPFLEHDGENGLT